MSVLLPLEIAARELPYKMLLALRIAAGGVPCYLGQKSAIARLLHTGRRWIYVDKGYHSGRSEETWALVRATGGQIVSLDEEGAVDFPDDSTLRNRYAEALFSGVDHVFLWGSRQKRFVPASLVGTDRVTVTGHPRFQMLAPSYRSLYEPKATQLVARFGDYVLLNTNMGFGNNLRGDAFVRRNYASRFPRLDDLMVLDRAKVSLMVEVARAVATRLRVPVVIRPHPEEDPDVYRKQLRGCANVSVVFEGSVVPWLLAARAVVHPDCTTAIEAVLLDRPALSLVPANADPALLTRLPVEVSRRMPSVAAVVSAIGTGSITTHHDGAATRALEEAFSMGVDSFGLIAERLRLMSYGKALDERHAVPMRTWMAVWADAARRAMRPDTDRLIANKLSGFDSAGVKALRVALLRLHPELAAVSLRYAPGLLIAAPAP